MTYPDIRAALGRERLNTLLADAEAARKARQARLYRRQAAAPARTGSPLRRRAGTGTWAVLRDGSAVVIRQVHSTAEYQIGLSPGPAEPGAGPADGATAPAALAHRTAGPA